MPLFSFVKLAPFSNRTNVGTHFVLALSRVRFRGRIAKWVPKKEAADP
jgi:hypothetical protein